jgi:hypothetical protein
MLRPLSLTTWWLLACAYLSAAGWILSGLGALNACGYAVVSLCGIAAGLAWARPWSTAAPRRLALARLRWRFRHRLPLLFLLYALLALLGGALYPPNNYDGLTYRLPRLLHWLAEQRWHWIDTNISRMNVSATGFEWLMAPIFTLTGGDRVLFLINTASYLLLPGLVFGAFTRLGVSKRAAWHWMWLLPAGYCFVLQAGGIGNDLVSAVYCLAAISFVLRARASGSFLDLGLGAVSAALLTGAKASNLPLLLPWALAAWPSLRLARSRPVASAAVAALALCISFLPMALANTRFTGDWAGDPANLGKLKIQDPAYGMAGNGLLLVVGNAAPPVAPFAKGWNELLRRQMESPWFRKLIQHFPRFTLGWNELAQEEGAGIGLGLSALLVLSLPGALRLSRAVGGARSSISARLAHGGRGEEMERCFPAAHASRRLGILVCIGAWLALLAYMAKMGSEAAPRLVTPYYPLLFASLLLLPGHSQIVKQRWWRTLAFLAALSALPAVVLSVSRPLWPAQQVCRKLQQAFPGNSLIERANTVYAVYDARADALAPLRKFIPDSVREIGFAGTLDDAETALWRPFGSRRILDLTRENLEQLLGARIRRVVASTKGVRETYGLSLDQWLAENHLHAIAREKLVTKVTDGPQEWIVAVTQDEGQ